MPDQHVTNPAPANPTQEGPAPQAGGPNTRNAFRLPHPPPRFIPRAPMQTSERRSPQLNDAAKYCSYMAGLNKHTMTVQEKLNGGFTFDCDIQDPKPE